MKPGTPALRQSRSLAVALLSSIVLGLGIPRVEIDASISSMLVAGDPAYAAHDRFKEDFGSDEVLSIAIPFSDVLEPVALSIQKSVQESLVEIEGVTQVTSLVSQEDPIGRGEFLDVVPLLPDQIDADFSGSKAQEDIRQRISTHPVWPGWLVSRGFTAVAFHVRLDDSEEGERKRDKTLEDIEQVLERVLPKQAYYLAGHPFMKSEISRSIANDLERLLPVTVGVMAILILVATRSLYVGLVTSAAVILAAGWMIGMMGWLGLGVTALSNTAPTILIALSTASFLHLASAFQSSVETDAKAAAQEALNRVWRPLWIAAITTAIGYASLSISSVPIVREFGQILACGMLGTAVVGSTFLPGTLALAPRTRRRTRFGQGFGLGTVLVACAKFVARYRAAILFGAILIGVALAFAATLIRVDSSGPRRFDEDSRFRVSSRFYRTQLSGDVVESIYLVGDPGDFLEPRVLEQLRKIQIAAEALPEVDKAISIFDHVARTYWVFRGEAGEPTALPPSAEAVAQLLLLYESSSELGDLGDYISADYSRVRVLLAADVQSSSESAQLREDLEKISENLLPEFVVDHSVVSTEMLLSQAADLIAVEQVKSASIALVLIVGLIGLSLRSVWSAAVMLIPNVLPLVVNLGVMALVGVALSDATSIISATAIGIAVDSTVHLLEAVRQGEKSLGSRRAAVIHALLTTGRPVVVTSVVVVIGFSLLLLSDFGSVAELGALTALTMIYCLIADLLVLPAELLLFSAGEPEGTETGILRYGRRAVAAVLRRSSCGGYEVAAVADRRAQQSSGVDPDVIEAFRY